LGIGPPLQLAVLLFFAKKIPKSRMQRLKHLDIDVQARAVPDLLKAVTGPGKRDPEIRQKILRSFLASLSPKARNGN
jgi:hypothetical protein